MRDCKQNGTKLIRGLVTLLLLWTLATRTKELPPDPNNAALLYYQAIALWSQMRPSYVDTEAVQKPEDSSDAKPDMDNPELVP